ncbi:MULTISPECIES: hypothetical protein [Paenarthrobacter]|uniref:Uncharacterized protein n=1 Tax=Paenarthrobacter ureafaciens TaxID=37931 RepID=A0AAX3EQS1_PAEUR|nr:MULTISPECIES: hypothetical protein [Paenarthrobacter]NKR12645.1 hypothetical protein [Arthrobacter sp. M5]NKR16510.1 hypothetical protein [Arthrobacter sp. M6]OEH60105.1 hypothetical protein A5N17_17385 [Arthrobacter sp. D2]OEH63741.1 hypothetical protein A5N13_14030 [Arthrobacter sp. D4]MDO5878271.1 hypothetical protein [Paenarthrobacter sp. SD-1]
MTIITHTREAGTLIEGTAKGDGSNAVLKAPRRATAPTPSSRRPAGAGPRTWAPGMCRTPGTAQPAGT